jgi:16S rRNA (cytidine1402-2'-O)-methyltransferase
MATSGTLFLIPATLSPNTARQTLPPYNLELLQQLELFFVENRKTARRFLKECGIQPPYDHLTFSIFDKHTAISEELNQLWPLVTGQDAGLLSEAGLPGLGDPGAGLVAACHRQGVTVKPLVGPSSIPLAISASGLSGQAFTFHGYLPVKGRERHQKLRQLEREARDTGYTQVFMETPYRNDQLLEALFKACRTDTQLCIAADLSAPSEAILTLPIAEWQQIQPTFHKRPAIFALGRP